VSSVATCCRFYFQGPYLPTYLQAAVKGMGLCIEY